MGDDGDGDDDDDDDSWEHVTTMFLKILCIMGYDLTL